MDLELYSSCQKQNVLRFFTTGIVGLPFIMWHGGLYDVL